MRRLYPWVDTTGESGVYPIGDAVDVYRAALDLLYKEGDNRPAVIVVHDTIEGGGEKPCPVKCTYVWHHKSAMDTSTILAFARQSPKRPRFRKFDYEIPIVLVSYNDQQRMEHDGIGYLAAHNLPNDMTGRARRIGFSLRFPGAWGLAQFGKVGFNMQHTEALVQVRHSCLEECGSEEALFLKRLNGRWTVIERIPTYAAAAAEYGNLRYRGPAGSAPTESEIVTDLNAPRVRRSEPQDAAAAYRAVLDSLYNFQGASPSMVILTDRFATAYDDLPAHRTHIDSALLQKYAFLSGIRTLPERPFKYRLPVRYVLGDSIPRLEKIGAPIAQQRGMDLPLWFGFMKEFPGAWGMVGFSRVAFNLPHTQAMVYSNHQCGQDCNHGDTWVLERSGEKWRVVERLSRQKYPNWEPTLFPLRYVGLDAPPNAYRRRKAYAVFMNAVTNRPLSSLELSSSGNPNVHNIYTADSAGRVDLGTIPFFGIVVMNVGCPDQSSPDSVNALQFLFSPGSDTTLISRLDFRQCFHKSVPYRLMGAQAFISASEARFVFPYRPPSENWDLPVRRTNPGTTDYFWTVDWNTSDSGDNPVALWLEANQEAKGPQVRSLAQLFSHSVLAPMLPCHSCDPSAVYADPGADKRNIFALVEGEKVVFIIRGRDAVRHVFPVIPEVVNFSTMVRHKPAGKQELPDIEESQSVVVNCRSSDSTGAARRRCNAPTNARFASPPIDSTAPRRVKVVALSYDGASLVRNLDVRIRSEDRKAPLVTRSTGAAGSFLVLQPPRDSVSIEAVCPARENRNSGGLALYLAPGRDTTLQLIVDPRRCSDK